MIETKSKAAHVQLPDDPRLTAPTEYAFRRGFESAIEGWWIHTRNYPRSSQDEGSHEAGWLLGSRFWTSTLSDLPTAKLGEREVNPKLVGSVKAGYTIVWQCPSSGQRYGSHNDLEWDWRRRQQACV